MYLSCEQWNERQRQLRWKSRVRMILRKLDDVARLEEFLLFIRRSLSKFFACPSTLFFNQLTNTGCTRQVLWYFLMDIFYGMPDFHTNIMMGENGCVFLCYLIAFEFCICLGDTK